MAAPPRNPKDYAGRHMDYGDIRHPPVPSSSSSSWTEREREGYDGDLFVAEDAATRYLCPICTLVCRNPVQTSCGHRFCDYCIRKWIRVQSKCPIDNEPLEEKHLFSDKIATREILGLLARCYNYKRTCPFQGELSSMQSHIGVCEYEDIVCPNNCGVTCQRRHLEEHQRTGCTTKCKHCFQEINVRDIDSHLAECRYNDFICPACGQAVIVAERNSHAFECPKAEAHCEFYAFGCQEKVLREQLAAHNASHTAQHLSLLLRHVQSPGLLPTGPLKPTPGLLQDNQCKSVDDEWLGPPRPTPRFPSIAPRSLPDSGVESNVDTLAEKSRVQDSKLSHMSQRMLVLEAKVQHLEKKVKEQSTTIRQQHDLITDLETRCSSGFFQWKITDFARRRREAQNGTTTVIHSPGFYSSFRGHKMCLRVNLNGVESGYGTHLSLFVHLMKGEYDDEVTWPFSGKIRLTVLDQGPEKQHVVEVLEGTERIAAFQRPPAGTTRNHKGFGYMEFMPLSRLLAGPMESKAAAYVLNDSLLIRCQVHELNCKLP